MEIFIRIFTHLFGGKKQARRSRATKKLRGDVSKANELVSELKANERAWILSDNTSGSSETRVTGIIRNILYYSSASLFREFVRVSV